MDTSLSVQGVATSKKKSSLFSKKGMIKALKVALPAAAIATLVPELAIASSSGGKDLLASGDATVGKTFGSGSSVVKWVILAEVIVGALMYMMTKNIKFLAGFAILSVFINIGMTVAGY
ncbi:type IV conjugative transfer system pilin TraA [Edwardsiella tarda]|uniref:Pilin n=1 Tax=Edwardsiella tarda TaxID=636 RepID=A0A2A7U7S6_EDWTA|nr:type IV conjugative transfer system pilin TraA [Edwardsiella tarda]PEH74456.1 type IV conjugative transfer system pilin TraA [Edwardsiella tarda]